jgi:hypothetical protein
MKRRYPAPVLLVLGLALLVGSSATDLHAAEKKKKKKKPVPTLTQAFQPKQLKEDLGVLQKILDSSHPGMYLYTSREDFAEAYRKAIESLKEQATLLDFYRTVAPLVEKVRCGHTYFNFPKKLLKNLHADIELFPVPVIFLGQRAYVDQANGPLPLGAEVTSLNGVTMPEILEHLLPYLRSDGFNQTMKYREMGDEFALYYYLHYGPTKTFEVTCRPAGKNEVIRKTLRPIVGSKLDSLMLDRHSGKGKTSKYKLEMIQDDIALLTVDSFDFGVNKKSRQRYRDFLKDNFDVLEQNEEIKSLILDLRRNQGGYVGNDTRIFSYFAQAPFRDAQSVEAIIQKIPQQEHLASFQFPRMIEKQWVRDFRKDDSGRYFLIPAKNPAVKPRNNVFGGRVFILISGWTHSSGAVLASQFLRNDNVTFIGEETGGGHAVFTAGNMMLYELPNTRCQLEVPLLLYRNHPGRKEFPKGSGIRPDHQVSQGQVDFIRNTDTVLAFAIKLATQP